MRPLAILLAGLFGLSMLGPTAAVAQSALGALKACTWIEDSTERLKCFDRAMREIENGGLQTFGTNAPASQAQANSLSPRQDARGPIAAQAAPGQARGQGPSGRDSFGLPDKREDEPDEIVVTIVEVKPDQYGKMLFSTSDGQLWHQTDSRRLPLGDTPLEATIKKGLLGATYMTIESVGRTIRVKRER